MTRLKHATDRGHVRILDLFLSEPRTTILPHLLCTCSLIMTSPGPSQSRLFTLATYKSTSNARLKSLYSDFLRQKHSNPTSYASNLEWWRQTIESVVANGAQSTDSASPDRLVLHADRTTLLDLFKVEGVGKPLSLSGVIVSFLVYFYIHHRHDR